PPDGGVDGDGVIGEDEFELPQAMENIRAKETRNSRPDDIMTSAFYDAWCEAEIHAIDDFRNAKSSTICESHSRITHLTRDRRMLRWRRRCDREIDAPPNDRRSPAT